MVQTTLYTTDYTQKSPFVLLKGRNKALCSDLLMPEPASPTALDAVPVGGKVWMRAEQLLNEVETS